MSARATLIHIRVKVDEDPRLHPWMKRLLEEGWSVIDQRFESEMEGYVYVTVVLADGKAMDVAV